MDLNQARFNMIEQQIRPWEVLDPQVLELLSVVRREDFVPLAHKALAFVDMEIPLGALPGQVMLAPRVQARLLQDLAVKKTDKVLDIGTGSGFMAALLAHRAQSVISLEKVPALATQAAANLRRGGVLNVASTASFQPGPLMAVYYASKAFVLSFTEALWSEERKHGVRVLAVCPGLTDTSFFEVAGDAAVKAAAGTAAVRFTRTPEQVVDNTMRVLSGQKPSFVDGVANALVWRGFTKVVPRRLMIAVSGWLIEG